MSIFPRNKFNIFKPTQAPIIRAALLITLLSLPNTLISQTLVQYDSLENARTLLNDLKISEALEILKALEKNYPQDENVMILYSQALYWNNSINATLAYIHKNKVLAPNSDNLNIHFGRILFELYHLKDSQAFLRAHLKLHPEDPETLLMLAKIAYWTGNPPKKVLFYLNKVVELDPDNNDANELKEEIRSNLAPHLNIQSSYYSDSQPLEVYMGSTSLSFYQTALFQPTIQVQGRQLGPSDQMLSADFNNKTVLHQSHTELNIRAGIFTSTWTNETTPSWALEINQKAFSDFILSAGVQRSPYINTLSSLSQNVLPTTLTGSFGRETGNNWTGKAIVQQWQFNDNNMIRTASAWILYPMVKHQVFKIDLGYAFMIADAEEDRFSLAVPELPSPAQIGQVIPGIYNPYFTPINQILHSGVLKIDLSITRKLSLGLNSNIGLYASMDNPNYVYYGERDVLAAPQNPGRNPPFAQPEEFLYPETLYFIYIPTRYFPIDLNGNLTYKINKNITFQTKYAYLKTVFFDSYTFSTGCNWNLGSMK